MSDETSPAKPINTEVMIAGRVFDLRNLSVKNGLELYAALPADYQKQADQIAYIVMTYASVRKIAEPHGMNPTELARKWIASAGNSDAGLAARDALSEAEKSILQQMDASGINPKELAALLPGGEALVGAGNALNGAGQIIDTVSGVAGAAMDGALNGAPRMWKMLSTLGAEGYGKLFGYGAGAPGDAAKSFAAATMALRHQSMQERRNQPLLDWNPMDNRNSQFGSNPVQYTSAGLSFGLEWIKQNAPFMEYIVAGWRWLTTWDKNKPGFEQLVEQARSEIRTARETTPANSAYFMRLTDAAMWDKEGEDVAATLKAANTIAGINAAGVAEIVTNPNAAYRDPDGVDHNLTRGKETGAITPGDRLKNDWNGLTGDGTSLEQTARVVTGAATVSVLARGVGEGVVRQWSNRPEVRAENAIRENNHYMAKAEKLRGADNSGWRFWEGADARAAHIKDLEIKALEAAHKALNNGEIAERRAPASGSFAHNAKAPIESKGAMQWVYNAPRKAGRVIGDAFGFIAEGFAHKTGETGVKIINISGRITEKAAGVAAKLGRGIPLVGVVFAGGAMAFTGSANADTVDGEKQSYWNQLDRDRARGIINENEFTYYRGLQTTYLATSLGGLFTAGVTEAAQSGLEYANPSKMDRYLPESLVKLVNGLVSGEEAPATAKPQAGSVNAIIQPAPMSNAELASAHQVVINQARIATTINGGGNFNLGTHFANVSSTAIGALSSSAAPSSTSGGARSGSFAPPPALAG